MYDEQLRSQCLSPETDNDEGCMSPCPDSIATTVASAKKETVDFQRILDQELEDENEDELTFLRKENAELRLVVAQLRSYISTLQRDTRRPSITSPTMDSDDIRLEMAPSTESGEGVNGGDDSAHSLRQDLLRMFSRRYSKGKLRKVD